MVEYRCDGCGRKLRPDELRYQVRIDVKAAYEEMEIGLADLMRDHRAELVRLVEEMKNRDPKEVEEQIFRRFEFDLCPPCQRAYLADPLHFHPENAAPESGIDIDRFLKSLGKGPGGGKGGEAGEAPESGPG
jgi:hypothetical protein